MTFGPFFVPKIVDAPNSKDRSIGQPKVWILETD